MNRSIWIAAALALGASLSAVTAPAVAQTPADIAGRWGLLGTWAPNCGAPPAEANQYLRYVRQGDRLVFERDSGKWRDANAVIRAAPAADGAIAVTINFEKFSQVRTNLLVRGTDGRLRVMSNYDDKGSYSVRDGSLVHNGKPTPWHWRC